METAKKIIVDDAKKILKGIGSVDANVIEAYVEIELERRNRNMKIFDNTLGGIGLISLIAGAAALLWIIGIAFYRGDAVSRYRIQMTELETRVLHVQEGYKALEEQDILIQKVKTMCEDFNKSF